MTINHPLLIPVAIAIIAGALLPIAFAPFNFYFIAILSLTTLFILVLKKSPRSAFILSYLYSFAYFGIGVYWLHISINLFGGVNLFGALFFTYALVAFISLYPALAIYLSRKMFPHHSIFALPVLWTLFEWLRGWLFTGFPWLNLGTSQTDSILKAFIPIIGDYGTTLVITTLSAAIVIITHYKQHRLYAVVFIGCIITAASWFAPYEWTTPKENQLSVNMVQGAIPQEDKWKSEFRQHTLNTYLNQSNFNLGTDLIIWPETAIPSLYHLAEDFLKPIQESLDKNTVFMSGIAYQDQISQLYFNSILVIDDKHQFYNKSHLVPFGEYMPFKHLFDRILRFLNIPMSDFTPGNAESKIIYTDKGVFGMSICYEDAYATIFKKSMPEANLFINVSNDAWFGDSFAPHQHLQIARMRAIENQRYLLRATNTGISAIIDHQGKIVTRSPQFQPYSLIGNVTLYEGSTPYSRYGNLPTLLICLHILIILLVIKRKRLSTQ